MKKLFSCVAILTLSCMLLAGCGGSAADSNYAMSYSKSAAAPLYESDSYGYYEAADSDYYYDEAAEFTADYKESGSYDQAPSQTADTAAAATGRKLIKHVNMSVQTLEFDKGCDLLENYVSQVNGYIESSNISDYTFYGNYGKSRYANYTVRVPSENLDFFLNQMGGVGTIYNQSMSTEDVTLSYLDVESRAKALEIQQERLLALLEEATSVDEIIALEDRISDVTYQLESKESTLRNYDSLVAFSTVNIAIEEVSRITEPEVVPKTVGERIAQGLSDTFYAIGEGFKDFAVWFVVNLPFIIIWLAVIALIVFLIRLIIKASKKGHEKRVAKKLAKKEAADAKKQAELKAAWAKKQAEAGNTENTEQK